MDCQSTPRLGFQLSVCFTIAAAVLTCAGAQTNIAKPVAPPVATIKTEFVEDAKLSNAEVDQLVALASQSGINDVVKVETFHYRPGSHREISVSSKERVDGRSISYDIIYVERIGWDSFEPEPNSKRVGPFWTRHPKRTVLSREFEIGKERIRLTIDEGVDVAIVDQAIPLIAAKKVRFENDTLFAPRTFSDLKIGDARRIVKKLAGDGYELWFGDGGGEILNFRVENGKVIVTSIAHYNV